MPNQQPNQPAQGEVRCKICKNIFKTKKTARVYCSINCRYKGLLLSNREGRRRRNKYSNPAKPVTQADEEVLEEKELESFYKQAQEVLADPEDKEGHYFIKYTKKLLRAVESKTRRDERERAAGIVDNLFGWVVVPQQTENPYNTYLFNKINSVRNGARDQILNTPTHE